MRTIKLLMILLLIGVFTSTIHAQFSLDAELRTRGEANNGYRTLPTENSQTAFFISQRTRLNLSFKKEKFSTYISLQDVRLWGQEDFVNKTGIQTSSLCKSRRIPAFG